MEIDVRARKSDVSDTLRAEAKAKLAKLERLAPFLEHAEVHLAEDRDAPTASRQLCEVKVEGHGHTLRARAHAADLRAAIDLVVAKLEHQAERVKGKLVGRSQPRRPKALTGA